MSRPDTIRRYPDDDYPYEEDFYGDYADDVQVPVEKAPRKSSVDAWMAKRSKLLPRLKRRRIAVILLALPALLPWIFTLRGWISLNEKDVLTNTEADVLGTGGELTFLICVSITPLITLTAARWFASLRRWYGVMFFMIGLSDSITASITGEFAGGPIGRVSGHTFLLAGLLIILLAMPVVITSNSRMQKALGKYWKRVQGVTYVIWGLIIIHLGLLDGFHTFDGPQGDGDPIFHQRLYQIVAISLPLVILRLPPVRRWIARQRAAGQMWKVWVAMMPLFTLYLLAMAFVINEELFTGFKIITMTPPAN